MRGYAPVALARPLFVTAEPATALERFASANDQAVFNALVKEHRGMVKSTCVSVLGPRSAELDDAVQETFVKLARSAAIIHGNVGAWLHQCARTTALDRWRALRCVRIPDESATARRCPPPDHAFVEQVQIVRECLADLPERPREMLQAYYFESRSQRTIARELGISHVAVGKRLVVALDMLRERCVRRGVGAAAIGLLLGADADGAIEACDGSPAPSNPSFPGIARSRMRSLGWAKGLALLGASFGIGWWCLLAHFGQPQRPIRRAFDDGSPQGSTRSAQSSPHGVPEDLVPSKGNSTSGDVAGWIAHGDLPVRMSKDRAVFATHASHPVPPDHLIDGMLNGYLSTARWWRLDHGPVALRLVADLPRGGRYAFHVDALFAEEGAPASAEPRAVVTIYWQSAPLLRVDSAFAACFAGLGNYAFVLHSPPSLPLSSGGSASRSHTAPSARPPHLRHRGQLKHAAHQHRWAASQRGSHTIGRLCGAIAGIPRRTRRVHRSPSAAWVGVDNSAEHRAVAVAAIAPARACRCARHSMGSESAAPTSEPGVA